MAQSPDLAAPLSAACQTTRAEVAHAVRHECAASLSDVLLGAPAPAPRAIPGRAAVEAAAAVMAANSAGTQARIARETTAFDAVYPAP